MAIRMLLSLSCLVLAGVSIPMMMHKVPPNSSYGFRTALTLSNPDIWYRANAFSGWALAIAATTSLALIWLLPDRIFSRPWVPVAVFAVPVMLSLVASTLYVSGLD